jgi:curved DNA-binding protein CbpA
LKTDLYSILGVADNATLKEIKTAFRRKARTVHPDLNPDDPQAESRFKALAEAYEVLQHPVRRRKYDMQRQRGFSSRDIPNFGEHDETAKAFAQAFTTAYARTQTVFFDALLPRYLEAFQRGPGYTLVFRMLDDLDTEQYMKIASRPPPSFAAKQQVHRYLNECPVNVDGGAYVNPLGELIQGKMTAIREPSLRYQRITLYAGSFFASGVRSVDGLSVAILPVLMREYIRFLELQLPPEHRPLHQRSINPDQPMPFTEEQARWKDHTSVGLLVAKRILIVAGVLVAARLIWSLL